MTELATAVCRFLGKPQTKKVPVKAEPEVVPVVAQAASSEPVSASTKQEPKPVNKKPLIFGGIAAGLVVLIVLGILIAGNGKKNASAVVSKDPASTAVVENTSESSTKKETTSEVQAEVETSDLSSAIEESVVRSDAGDSEVQVTSLTSTGFPIYGLWDKIAYEDKGTSTKFNTDDLYIRADGSIYSSKSSGETPVLTADENTVSGLDAFWISNGLDAYSLTVEYSFQNSFNDEYIDKTDDVIFTGLPNVGGIGFNYGTNSKALPEENPTGLTYEDCYPPVYLFLHITGTYQETPLKTSAIDTWMVYEKQYPYLALSKWPVLEGNWQDSLGNTWVIASDGTFTMTDTAGNAYPGKEIRVTAANEEKINFFERLSFVFEEYTTDRYAVVSFDGDVLKLLDESWNEMVLSRVNN